MQKLLVGLSCLIVLVLALYPTMRCYAHCAFTSLGSVRSCIFKCGVNSKTLESKHDLLEKPVAWFTDKKLTDLLSFDEDTVLCPNIDVDMREGPCTHYPLKRRIRQGDKVISTGEISEGCGKAWIKIKENGWIVTDYMRACDVPPRMCATHSVNMLDGPCHDKNVLSTLEEGYPVQPLGIATNCGQQWIGIEGGRWVPLHSFAPCTRSTGKTDFDGTSQSFGSCNARV